MHRFHLPSRLERVIREARLVLRLLGAGLAGGVRPLMRVRSAMVVALAVLAAAGCLSGIAFSAATHRRTELAAGRHKLIPPPPLSFFRHAEHVVELTARQLKQAHRSRMSYRGIGARAALDLARRPAGVLGLAARSFYQPLTLSKGERIVRFISAHQALVREPASQRTRRHRHGLPARVLIAQSTLPMTVGKGSHRKVVSLALKHAGSALVPVAPLVPLTFSPDRVDFSSLGVSLTLEGAHPSLLQDLGRESFQPSVFKDTDLVMQPLAVGAEQWLQLRSPAAPQTFRFALSLPAGATATLQQDESIKIVQGKATLLFIPAASATDALGRPVNTKFSLAGPTLTLTVLHRQARHITYPLAVDPIEVGTPCEVPHVQDPYQFIASECGQGPTQYENTGPGGTADSWIGQWIFQQQPGGAPMSHVVGSGLYVYGTPNTYYQAGDWGEYVYRAPAGAFIQRVDLENTEHTNSGVGAPPPATNSGSSFYWEGIYDVTNQVWEPETINDGLGTVTYLGEAPYTQPYFDGGGDHFMYVGNSTIPQNPQGLQPMSNFDGTNGNAAVFGLVMGSSGVRPSSPLDLAFMQGATVWLYDFNTPTITPASIPASSDAWVDDTGNLNHTVAPSATESGLGVKYFSLSMVDANKNPDGTPQGVANSCTGDHTGAGYCPTSWATNFTYQLPEGQQTVTVGAGSAMGAWSTRAFTTKIDRSPPTQQTPSGTLWNDRYDPQGNPNGSSPSNPLTGLSYPMSISSADSASGVAEVDVQVDNNAPTALTQSCPRDNCPNAVSTNYTFNNEAYAAGSHTITIITKDWLGQQGNAQHDSKSQSFTIYTKPSISLGSSQTQNQNDQAGLESFYDYRKIATGAGSYARVNLASGNLVWDDIPVVDPGRGLSTFVELAYNSQFRLGDISNQLLHPLLPALSYDQAGQGFSIGIDGLTRLNEPLNLSAAVVGKISFTDIDGTSHTFIQDSSDPQHWIAPPGVFLWLRQYSTSNTAQTWAITRPDGVTFFFDSGGYETSIQDREDNTLTFAYQYFQSGTNTPCVVNLPVGVTCDYRVTSVTDATHRPMTVSYHPATDPGAGEISDIVDHAGRDLQFTYDSNGDLVTMAVSHIQSNATDQRQFQFSYGGANDAIPGVVPSLLGLLPGLIPQGLTAIKDPNGHTTSITYCAPGALISPSACGGSFGSCPTDPTNLLAPLLGGLLGLEPKCVEQITDRGSGQTSFTYASGTDGSGNEIHTTTTTGPRTVPAGSGARPDQWIDTTDAFGRPTKEVDPLGRTTLLTWNNTGQAQPSAQCPSSSGAPGVPGAPVAANTLQSLVRASTTNDQVTTLYCYEPNGRLTEQQGPTDTAPGSTQSQAFRTVTIGYQESAGTLTGTSDTAHCSSSDQSLCFVADPTALTDQNHQTTQFQLDPSNPSDGLVTQITDPSGAFWSTKYDWRGLVVSQTDPGTGTGPQTTTFGNFDANGMPGTMTMPVDSGSKLPSTSYYNYDALGNLLSVTDPRNTNPQNVDPTAPTDGKPLSPYTTYFVYDHLSRVTDEYQAHDTAGPNGTAANDAFIHTTYSYDANDNLLTQTSGALMPGTGTTRTGNVFTYGYTPMDWLASRTSPPITQADGTTKPAQITSYCYDEQGNQIDQVNPLGQPGEPTQPTGLPAACPANGGAAGFDHMIYTVYDADGEALVHEQMGQALGATNQITSYAYDNRGEQIGMADPANNAGANYTQAEANAQSATSRNIGPWRTSTQYDAAGNPIAVTQNPGASDGRVYTTRKEYDADGNVIATEDARGPTVTADPSTGQFDLAASPVVSDTTVYAYDARDLLASVTDPAGEETEYARHADGKICTMISPRGASAGAPDQCGSAGPFATNYSYYAQGWLAGISLPSAKGEYTAGNQTSIAYTRDAAGYPTTILDPRSVNITNTFYDNGALQSTSAPWWWTYDPQGSGTPGPDPNAGGQGQVSGNTPGGGMPIREKTPQELYAANASANTPSLPSGTGAGKFGQVAAQTLPGVLPPAGQTSFAYDGDGNLTQVQDQLPAGSGPDPNGITTLSYDQLDQPIEVDQPFDASTPSARNSGLTKTYYSYDADGNQTTVDTPQTTNPQTNQNPADTTYRTTNAYDGLDRLASTTAPGAGSASGQTATPRVTTYCYTLDPQTTSSSCTPTVYPVPGNDTSTPGLTFAVTNRVAITSPSTGADPNGEVTDKDYDALGNLLASTNPNGNETTYAYDQIGDQTRVLAPKGQQPQNNPAGQDLKYATTMTYDPAARLSTSADGYGAQTSYGYDANGNITLIKQPGASISATNTASVSHVSTFAYDGRDLRWKTTTGSLNNDGNTTGTNDNSGGINDARTTITEYDGNGNLARTVNPAGVDQNGNAYYPSTDPNANLDATTNVYDNNNQLTTSYLPWGCNNTSNDQKPSSPGTVCAPSTSNTVQTGNDTRRFKEIFARDNLGRATSFTEAYDYTNPKAYNTVTTKYGYQPNGWISSETDPTLPDSSYANTTSSMTNYAYDPAGDQLQWATTAQDGPRMGGSKATRTVNDTYWPSGQLSLTSGTGTTASGTSTHNYSYYYEPAGQQSEILVGTNTDGSSDNATMRYYPDGELRNVNETIPSNTAYDTTYTYDQNGNVATRQQDGTLNPDGTYTGGNRSYFTYDHNDRETSNLIISNTNSQPSRLFTTAYWRSGQPELTTRQQIPVGQPLPPQNAEPGDNTCPATSPPPSGQITECKYYNDNGAISQDVRSTDPTGQSQAYTYDTNGNRANSENGQHLYNALDQEVQWTRGGIDTATNASTVNYLLDGTGGTLRTVDTAGARTTSGGLVTTTTWNCSAATIGSAETSDPTKASTPCQLDANRVEVSNTSAPNTTIANPTSNYCYDAFGELVRVTQSSCPTSDSNAESFNSLQGENPQTTSVYNYSAFGQQKAVKAPDPATGPQNPSIDNISYQYDALDRRYTKTDQIGSGTQQTDTYGYIGLSNDISKETTASPTDTVVQTYDYGSSGQRLGVYRLDPGQNASGVYHSYDIAANGSVAALENADGTITPTNRYHYTPYGNLEKGHAAGGDDPTSTTTPEQSLGSDAETNNYRFEGFYLDSGVDTYDLQARNYLPQQALYTTQDTFQSALGNQELRDDPLTQNLYAFAGGNPTSNVEFDGHREQGFGGQTGMPVPGGGPAVCVAGCGPTAGTEGPKDAAAFDSGRVPTTCTSSQCESSALTASRVTIRGTTFTFYSSQAIDPGNSWHRGEATGIYLPSGVTLAAYKMGLVPSGYDIVGARSVGAVSALGAGASFKLPAEAGIVLPPPPCPTACQVASTIIPLWIPDFDLLDVGRAAAGVVSDVLAQRGAGTAARFIVDSNGVAIDRLSTFSPAIRAAGWLGSRFPRVVNTLVSRSANLNPAAVGEASPFTPFTALSGFLRRHLLGGP